MNNEKVFVKCELTSICLWDIGNLLNYIFGGFYRPRAAFTIILYAREILRAPSAWPFSFGYTNRKYLLRALGIHHSTPNSSQLLFLWSTPRIIFLFLSSASYSESERGQQKCRRSFFSAPLLCASRIDPLYDFSLVQPFSLRSKSVANKRLETFFGAKAIWPRDVDKVID